MTAPAKQLSDGNPSGSGLGQSASDLISFYGVTPIAQRASANQASPGTTAATATTPYGFASVTQANATINTVDEIVNTLTALGLWKGSA